MCGDIFECAASGIILWRSWLGTCSGGCVYAGGCRMELLPQGDVSSPGHRFHLNPHSSGAQEELEESIWSLTWRKLDFPLYLEGFSVESAVREALPCSSCGGEQWDLGGWSVHPALAQAPAGAVRGNPSLLGVLACGSWTSIATIFPCHNSQSLFFF